MQTDLYLQQLISLPNVVDARLSPDGRWVAFVWQRIHQNLDVFCVATDGSAAPFALTHTPEATRLVNWTPDSHAVLVEEDHDSDERSSLFRVNLDHPGQLLRLTEDRPAYFLRGGSLSPDGGHLYYGANFDFAAGRAQEATWIYRHDLETGERILLAQPLKPNYVILGLNRQGTHLIYTRKDRHPAGRQVHLVDADGSQDREILYFGDSAKVSARWFPDGERILLLSESTGAGSQEHISLGVYNRIDGSLQWLIDDPQRSIESAWVSPDGAVVVDEIVNAVHHPTYLDEGGREHSFPAPPGNLLPLGRARDGAWIGLYYSANAPTEIVRFMEGAASSADLHPLTRVWEHSQLQPQELHPANTITWTGVDGLEIQGWLYRAQPNPKRAIIFVHGGPTSHSENRLNAQIQYFVQRGFNVLDVNYRGSTGFGLKFRELIKEDGWGGREQSDIAAGAEMLIDLELAEPGRVGVTGTSYGGYSAWCQITHMPPEVIGAAAPICGMTDLVVDYQTTRPDLRPLSEEMIGGRPDQVPEKYFERSPINHVQNIRGALLVVQGAQDPNVTPENVRQVRSRLEEHQISYELLVFEDEGHGIGKPANQSILYQRLADFFEHALG